MAKTYSTTPQTKQTIAALWRLEKVVLDTLDFNEVVQKIVDSVLTELGYLKLGYRIVVLALVDEEEKSLKRISISKTKDAERALEITPVPFENIVIPLRAKDNLCIQVLKKNRPSSTHDWKNILVPPFTVKHARAVQKIVGIKTSTVYPVTYQGKTRGIIIFSMVKDEKEVSKEERELIRGFTDIVGLAVQNARLYSALEDSSKKLKRVNKRLKDLDKLKDEFISMAAHEFRAPMTAVKGYLSMVLEGDAGEIPKKTHDFLADAEAINNRLIRLVNNMLNVEKIEEGRLIYQTDRVNLSEVAKEVFDSFKFEAKRRGLDFSLKIPSKINDSTYVDPDRIHEVVGNFVSNAIKYTEKGSVLIKLSQPEKAIIRLEVIDTGFGISAEEQEKLFRKFSRIESTVGKTMGTGLGLYISKLLIEKFKGKIGLESEVGKGSTFWFELPLRK